MNVSFLRGSEQSLQALLTNKTGIVEGAFYLTDKTNKLYFGASSTSIVPLNKDVLVVQNIAALPSTDQFEGQFYYAKEENVLAVWSASDNKWVQINKNTDTKLSKNEVAVTANGNKATVANTITDTANTKYGDGANGSAVFSIAGSNLKVAVTGTEVTLTSDEYALNKATVTGAQAAWSLNKTDAIDGNTVSVGNIALKAGNYVTISQDENGVAVINGQQGVTVTGLTGSEVLNDKTANLGFSIAQSNGDAAVAGTVQLTAGAGVTFTQGNDAEGIIINSEAADMKLGARNGASGANQADIVLYTDDVNDNSKGTVSVVGGTNVTVAQSDNTITITSKDTNNYVSSGEFQNKASDGFNLELTREGLDEKVNIDFNPGITVGENASTVNFKNGVATLAVPTIAEVKEWIEKSEQTTQAMRFKGTVNSSNALPEAGVLLGDTYKVAEAGTYGGKTCKVGDVLIATGTTAAGSQEITSNLAWELIPAGDDIDEYIGVLLDNGIKVQRQTSGDNIDVVGMTVAGTSGNPVNVTATKDTSANINNIKVEHKTVTTTGSVDTAVVQEAKGTATFTVVSDVTTDGYGHISGYKTKEITVKDTDTHNRLSKVEKTATAYAANDNKGVTLGTTVTMTDADDTQSATQKLYSANQSISITNSGNDVVMNFVWGTF